MHVALQHATATENPKLLGILQSYHCLSSSGNLVGDVLYPGPRNETQRSFICYLRSIDWVKSALLTSSTVGSSSPAPTSQWAMPPYRHVAQPLNPQRSLQPPAYVANTPGRPGPSHNQWQPITCGLYNASEGPRCNYITCHLHAHNQWQTITCGLYNASEVQLYHLKELKQPFRGQGPSPPAI